MATKTISVDMEAYERLRRARRTPTESFSQVIKRAQWPGGRRHTLGDLLEAFSAVPAADEATLDFLEEAQRNDVPPDDPWQED